MDPSSTTAPAIETTVNLLLETDKSSTENSSYHTEIATSSNRLRGVTDTALGFLSNASNETLGACAIGLFASTYLALGRVGLILIGAVGGIVLHATWEGLDEDSKDLQNGSQKSASRRKELGIEVAKRLLDWKDKRNDVEKNQEDEGGNVEASVATTTLDYSEFRPATAAALTVLTDAVIRDYVRYLHLETLFSIESG
jgi:hypothetical protein